MTKDELIKQVAQDTGASEAEAGKVLDAAIDAITTSIAGGDIVRLGPLGSFSTRDEGEHQVHVPGREGLYKVPAQKRIIFHASKALKAAANGGQPEPEPTPEPAEPEGT